MVFAACDRRTRTRLFPPLCTCIPAQRNRLWSPVSVESLVPTSFLSRPASVPVAQRRIRSSSEPSQAELGLRRLFVGIFQLLVAAGNQIDTTLNVLWRCPMLRGQTGDDFHSRTDPTVARDCAKRM